jgi:hypothetical protein
VIAHGINVIAEIAAIAADKFFVVLASPWWIFSCDLGSAEGDRDPSLRPGF